MKFGMLFSFASGNRETVRAVYYSRQGQSPTAGCWRPPSMTSPDRRPPGILAGWKRFLTPFPVP